MSFIWSPLSSVPLSNMSSYPFLDPYDKNLLTSPFRRDSFSVTRPWTLYVLTSTSNDLLLVRSDSFVVRVYESPPEDEPQPKFLVVPPVTRVRRRKE